MYQVRTSNIKPILFLAKSILHCIVLICLCLLSCKVTYTISLPTFTLIIVKGHTIAVDIISLLEFSLSNIPVFASHSAVRVYGWSAVAYLCCRLLLTTLSSPALQNDHLCLRVHWVILPNSGVLTGLLGLFNTFMNLGWISVCTFV